MFTIFKAATVHILPRNPCKMTKKYINVPIDNLFISYQSESKTAPTHQEWDQLKETNEAYFGKVIEQKFANDPDNTYINLKLIAGELGNLHGDAVDKPKPEFNLCQEYKAAEVSFTSTAGDENPPPTAFDIFTLIQKAITEDYLLHHVRSLEGTPFAQVVMAFSERKEIVPPP